MRQLARKTLALTLAAALLGALPALAAEDEEEGPSKEEVIYINLSSDGAVSSVDAVNIFELDRPGQIVDRGEYASVRNMTGTDPVELDGDKVTIDAGPGRLYYEGRLENAQIPWDIALRYFLDGKEVSAQELAGASGEMELRLTVTENPAAAPEFFADYALQITVTLDRDLCRDIRTEGATEANVGSDRQLSYTVLPGTGADISVTAEVEDFEMDAVALNGVRLALDVELDQQELLDKIQELLDAIDALDAGAGELSDGAGALSQAVADSLAPGAAGVQNGAWGLYTALGEAAAGAADVDAGAQSLSAGLATLNEQTATLTGGSAAILTALQDVQARMDGAELTQPELDAINGELAQMETGVQTLVGALDAVTGAVQSLAALQAGYEAAAQSLSDAVTALQADPEIMAVGTAPTYITNLWGVHGALTTCNGQLAAIVSGLTALSSTAEALRAGLETVSGLLAGLAGSASALPGALAELQSGVDTLVGQYAALDAGIQAYAAGVAQATEGAASLAAGTAALSAGVGEIYDGSATLAVGTGTLTAGVGELSEAAAALDEGAVALSDGTDEMKTGAGDMDQQLQDKLEELLGALGGQEEKPVSFVSPENGPVESVQFVIRAPAIKKPAPETRPPEPEQPESFWQRLADLF